MNPDPLDSLDAFYQACQTAPVPAGLVAKPASRPWWVRAAVPLGGLSMGAALAVAIVMAPVETSPEEGAETARAIAQQQLPDPPRSERSKVEARRAKWSA